MDDKEGKVEKLGFARRRGHETEAMSMSGLILKSSRANPNHMMSSVRGLTRTPMEIKVCVRVFHQALDIFTKEPFAPKASWVKHP